MSWLQFGFSAFFIIFGIILYIVGIAGVYKFKFVLNKMHSGALIDTLGLFLVVVGLSIANGFNSTSIKLYFIIFFLWITSPLSSHLISKIEFMTDGNLKDNVKNPENEKETIVDLNKDNYDDDLKGSDK